MTAAQDARYLEIFLDPIRTCARYRPAFGKSDRDADVTLAVFQTMYGADPLYRWIGIDSPLMYAAHKAAGGMTSIYRQIGIGCERLIRAIIQDSLTLDDLQVRWGYKSKRSDGKIQDLTLDARIDCRHINDATCRSKLEQWLADAAAYVSWESPLQGAAFEVRQGYKSADSKRQNADIRFGLEAYSAGYLPVVMIVSTQVSQSIVKGYRASKLLVLTGTNDSDPLQSSYAFMEQIVGYSLAGFFARNAPSIRGEVEIILERLLSPA